MRLNQIVQLGIIQKGLVILWVFYCCNSCGDRIEEKPPSNTLFSLLSTEETGLDFINKLTFSSDFNVYKYRNYYNGGGVALGDVNNDGFLDIYFTSNMSENKLYLNKGEDGFSFRDVSEKAGVQGGQSWSTGVSMADVNGDGWLDIYVCNSGNIKGGNRPNELFINNGPNSKGLVTFTEKATEFQVADMGFSTHAAFFDYDRDGDLDMYLLNNSFRPIGTFNLRINERFVRDSVGGDKLYRNEGGYFKDVSQDAGIYGSIIGFGMGVTVGDFDNDDWPDIYVSNDFFERDYIYMNNGNGTFRETLESQTKSISATSMGADAADLNNDGLLDIFVTEMLPKDEARLKTKTTFENWNKYQFNLENDYYHQFTRNTLQFNQGKKPYCEDIFFSEAGRLSGVEATDWSWGALIFDMENDGLKDIFVANGIFKDLTDQDYIQFISDEATRKEMATNNKINFEKLVEVIPSNPIPNVAFKNLDGNKFEDVSQNYGLSQPSFSNGSAYGDLDNDGDLDLVVNNVNMPCFVYKNKARQFFPENGYLKLKLDGRKNNTMAIGSKITVWVDGTAHFQELNATRGFQSSVDPRPNFGLGKSAKIDSLLVKWPDGKTTFRKDIAINQMLELSYFKDTNPAVAKNKIEQENRIFSFPLSRYESLYSHKENKYVDFDRDPLINFMLSTEGPKVTVGDVNGDGLEDFFIGGAKSSSSALYIQNNQNDYLQTNVALFEADKEGEVVDAIFFDADQDGDMDLYVANGGNEFSNTSVALSDILYINDGKGGFSKSSQILPNGKFESSSCVKAADYDGDGDTDLFVGIRLVPNVYGFPCNGYLLENNKGKFTNVTSAKAPGLLKYGMFTDAVWSDIDLDGDPDLITVGDWMPVSVFENVEGALLNRTESAGLSGTNGWWNTIEEGDFDNDGDMDFVLGNHGENSRFRATLSKPISMYVNDFDSNGKVEQIISGYNNDESYPIALKHDLVNQMPHLKKKYLKYESYKFNSVHDIFTAEEMKGSITLEVTNLQSSLLINQGQGNFEVKTLPYEVQTTPIYAFVVKDFDNDGYLDLVCGGNLYGVKPEFGRYDASFGSFLKGSPQGFKSVSPNESGLWVEGEIRDLELINGQHLIVAKNNAPLEILKIDQPK
ncbi:VCBS repeat-containing protein [Arenibacter sp. ARW7G5Y1]|uniref:VCBS repeat-containing protein n=1 Tax=Arenibacter sp. ARW7G5Y1 TaxID=2135619 RepID=UPI000D75837B|nr:VCBS repeat-containing protein [Arenibacter sp. ARW7G5Y1]PXX30510.1 VCBS repeat protein [Arenibacter sp. ARW7G5Y1]